MVSKRSIITLIILLIFIYIMFFLYSSEPKEIPIEISIETPIDIDYITNDKPKEVSMEKPLDIKENLGMRMPKNILDNAMNELRSIEFQNDMLLDIGFNENGIQKISSEDRKKLLATKDLPIEMQKDINKTLKKIKKNGFDETSDEYSDEIVDIMNYIISSSEQVSNIRFSTSTIPSVVFNNYNYMGYTFPGVYSTEAVNGSYGTVRRVFQSFDSSHILIIEESGLNENAGSYSLEAFINSEIYGYPATYVIKKSPNNNTYALLTWLIPNYDFRLYYVGILNNETKQILLNIGYFLSEINILKEDNNTVEEDSNPINLNDITLF